MNAIVAKAPVLDVLPAVHLRAKAPESARDVVNVFYIWRSYHDTLHRKYLLVSMVLLRVALYGHE